MTGLWPWLHPLLALTLSPLLFGVINRVKARVAGRQGQPVLQTYHDLLKLLRKGAVYSRTTTWVFRAGPIVGLAALTVALTLLPMGSAAAVVSFPGDLVLFVYLIGLARFAMMLAALDTGSAFEGMGASREAQFSFLAEPALLLGLVVMARLTGGFSLSGILGGLPEHATGMAAPALLLTAAALFVVLLTECARIPVDDPNTHLELTMIHEVMVLDHGGVDFGLIHYASALKMWLLATVLVNLLMPFWALPLPALQQVAGVAGVLVVAAVIGVVESAMARLKLLRIPQLLVAAAVLAALALALTVR
jgi:formate hydrogenlyase subunit 4